VVGCQFRGPCACGSNHGRFQAVFELSHVAGPLGGLDGANGRGRKCKQRQGVALRCTLAKRLGELAQVIATLAEGRKTHGQHVESVVEIFAKALLLDQKLEIRVGGGDQADVCANRARTPECVVLLRV
jgi:hypothetical protein